MAIDFESLKDSAVVAVQSGVEKAKELATTGAAKAKELADTGVAKAKELTEIGKLKVQNSVEQDSIRKAYAELGKLYYAECGSDPAEPFADLCRKITDSMAKISYNNERIADIKAASAAAGEPVEEEPACEEPAECPCGETAEPEEPCCCDAKPEEPEAPCCCDAKPEEPEAPCCDAPEEPKE